MLALEGHIEADGGSVVLRCPVERIERDAGGLFRLTTGGDNPGAITCKHLVNSAGLHASKLARTLALRRQLPPARDLLRQGPILRAIRPLAVQAPHLPDAGRRLARPARHRRHRRALQVRPRHRVDARHRLQLRAREAREVPREFLDFIRSYYPGLEVERLHPDYTGMRPKLYREGEPVPDFAIHGPATHGLDGLVALYGIESPG